VGDVRDSLADIGKGGRLLGYKGEIKFDEGLRRSIEWYRENL
jgi:nucleoside-diphosphate-sugar epimerase